MHLRDVWEVEQTIFGKSWWEKNSGCECNSLTVYLIFNVFSFFLMSFLKSVINRTGPHIFCFTHEFFLVIITIKSAYLRLSEKWKCQLLSCIHVPILLCLSVPMDCSPPGSSVYGIFQASTLEWVAIPFSRGSSQPRDQSWVSCIAGRFFTICVTRETHLR